MKKYTLALASLMVVSGFANANSSAELACTTQQGSLVNISSGKLESLVDANGVNHYWIQKGKRTIVANLDGFSKELKDDVIDSFKSGYNLEMCVNDNDELLPIVSRIFKAY
ncbi:hypothetical protein [Photobacterium damselae]